MADLFDFSATNAWDAVEIAANVTANELAQHHSWDDQSGAMRDSIAVVIADDSIDIVIDVPYAEYVDYRKPFINDVAVRAEEMVLNLLDDYLVSLD